MQLFRLIAMATLVAVLIYQPDPAQSATVSGSANSYPADKASPQDPPTDQIIIKYKATVAGYRTAPDSPLQLERLSEAAQENITYFRPMSGGAQVVKLPKKYPLAEVQAIARRLAALPEVAYAEPDAIMLPALAPNDPYYPEQWQYISPTPTDIYGIDAEAAWDITTGSPYIYIADLDTGLTNHSEFAGRTVSGYDFISPLVVANDGDGRDPDPSDPGDWCTNDENSSWHGTHTAGIIAAASNNGSGVTGVNWVSKFFMVRVLGKCGGLVSDIVDGMRWAAGLHVDGVPDNSHPAKVENLSLGGGGSCGLTYQSAINEIISTGTTIVVAAANSSTDASSFQPANCNGVIAVSATDTYGLLTYYSNFGSIVKISAPGGDMRTDFTYGILSTLNTGAQTPGAESYNYMQGTSMAAPMVTGVVSLLYSLDPTLTPSQILSIIQNTSTPFPAGTWCATPGRCGTGILNAAAAVQSLNIIPADKTNTTATITSILPEPTNVGDPVTIQFSVIPTSGSGTPTGTVLVSDGNQACSARIIDGQCNITFLTSGSKVITATYTGDGSFNGSVSAGMTHTVNKIDTTTSITSDLSTPTAAGEPVTITYNVIPSIGSGIPTGDVTVSDGTQSCTTSVAAGQCNINFTSGGIKTLVATYAGDAAYNGSASTGVTHTVDTPPGSFHKLSPDDAITAISAQETLSWEASDAAAGYAYCITISIPFTGQTTCDTGWQDAGSNTNVTLPMLEWDTTYYWQARADGFGNTYADDGAWWQFTTLANYEIFLPSLRK